MLSFNTMKNYLKNSFKYFLPLVLFCLFFSCKKEHLQPSIPAGGTSTPLVYISAILEHDSVYFEGGVNSYIGATSVNDSLTNRTFNFSLKNPQNPSHSCFLISINNYQNSLGAPQTDLDNTIYSDMRDYQFSLHPFSPLLATLTWIDSTGVSFTTGAIHQSHLFSITNVEDVVFNSKNYKKLAVEFDCLIASVHDTLHVTNGKATILFSAN